MSRRDDRPAGSPGPLEVLDGRALRRWAVRARTGLAARRVEIDALNVFPVPDGDTGTNMFLTLDSAVAQSAEAQGADELSTFARASVLGARGNSGVIVSQLVRGLVEVLARPATAGGADAGTLARAFRRASDLAYACVGDPAEGTILTVARAAAEAAEAQARSAQASLTSVVDAALQAARTALAQTPQQLAALRAAGVVDAGASGLVTVLDALKRVVDGGSGSQGHALLAGERPLGVPHGEVVPADYVGPRYEIIHTLRGAEPDSLRALRGHLGLLGESVVVADDGQVARVHAHVDDVDEACRLAEAVGEVDDVVVTDLHAQASATRAASLVGPGARAVRPEVEGVPADGPLVVACADGAGLRATFASEGAIVVPSGPGARASVGAILAALEPHPERPVVLLPNDDDVLLTSSTAADELRAQGRVVHVVQTRSDVAGLAALAVLDRGDGVDSAVLAMREAADATRSGVVALASRPADTPAGHCEPGDVLGIDGAEIAFVGTDGSAVARDLLDRLLDRGGELVTLVTGETGADLVAPLVARCGARDPSIEVVVHEGGLTAYLLMVGVE